MQLQILERFTKSDLTRVRNKTGYFIGILKQARTGLANGSGFGAGGGAGAPSGGFRGGGGARVGQVGTTNCPGFQNLPQAVKTKFQNIFATGQCSEADIESCVYDSLADFTEDIMNTIVDSFAAADLNSVRSKTAFFIGILKKHRGQPRRAAAAPGYPTPAFMRSW